jgi:creatinine amidohydrolase/Fe(II)-dependent formamide hydrolase-like protein
MPAQINIYDKSSLHLTVRGVATEAPDIPGTIRVRGSVLTEYLKDVIAGYVSIGFRSIVVLNGHYENENFLFEVLELCGRKESSMGQKLWL